MSALQLACPFSSRWFSLNTDLVHHQEVFYGFPIGENHISRVLYGFRQDLLHLLGDDTWGGTSQVCMRGGNDYPQYLI